MEDHFLFYCVSIWWREDWIPSSASWDQVTRPGSVAAFYFLATAASWLNAGIDGRTAGKQELALLWHVCPKFTCWNSNAGCDGIRRQGLWQVIRVGLDEVMEWRGSQLVLVIKNPSANAGDMRDEVSRPGSGISTGGGMTAHSSILAWRISWTEEPGGLQSTWLQRVGHDWATELNWTELKLSHFVNQLYFSTKLKVLKKKN